MTHGSQQPSTLHFESTEPLFMANLQKLDSIFSSIAHHYGRLSGWMHIFIWFGLVLTLGITSVFIPLPISFVMMTILTYALCSFLLFNHHHASEQQATLLQETLKRYEEELSTSIADLKIAENGLNTTLNILSQFNQEYGGQLSEFDAKTNEIETQTLRFQNSTTMFAELTTRTDDNTTQLKHLLETTRELLFTLEQNPRNLDIQPGINTGFANLSDAMQAAHDVLITYHTEHRGSTDGFSTVLLV